MSLENRTGIIAFCAKRGEGKTLLMSIFLYAMASMGRKVYSNYGLYRFPADTTFRMDKEFFKEFFADGDMFADVSHVYMAIDEIPTYLDSYNFNSKRNRIFSNFVRQTRKRNVHLWYTTQQMNMVPKRIRQNTDMVIIPQFIISADTIVYEIFQYSGDDTMQLIGKKYIKNASMYFGIYDTDEIIDILDEDD